MNPCCDRPADIRPDVPKTHILKSLGQLARCAAWCGVTLLGLPAFATLATPISVSLIAPGGITGNTTPFTLIEPVGYGSPIGLSGSGDISGFMLPGEQISLLGDSILIQADQGNDVGGTGYLGNGTDHARYEFDGLGISGRTITGFNVYAFDGYGTSGFSGVTSGIGVSLFSMTVSGPLDTLDFNLDDLLFVDRGNGQSGNYAQFRIDILSTPDTVPPPVDVPEPGSLMLVAAALLALRLVTPRWTLGRAVSFGAAHA
jgi:hypothetical protein